MPKRRRTYVRRKVTQYRRKPIQLFNRAKKFEPRVVAQKRLVVVGNATQKAKLREKKVHHGAVILTAQEIEAVGCFGIEITEVTWIGGWALECDHPEIVCERVAQRLKSCAYTGV